MLGESHQCGYFRDGFTNEWVGSRFVAIVKLDISIPFDFEEIYVLFSRLRIIVVWNKSGKFD